MKFFTRIPFTFWIVAFGMSLLTPSIVRMGETPLLYVVALYWGFTLVIIGLALGT